MKATETMRAVVQEGFGAPEILRVERVPRPEVGDEDVLVRVLAASVNAFDWRTLTMPTLLRVLFGMGGDKKTRKVPGVDLAGIVEKVGGAVTSFRPGDEVIGHRSGAFAEFVKGKATNFVAKPAGVTFEQAAATPVAGLTALQGLRDHGQLQSGQRILINGASGGVGSMAVQIAKALGAHVTAVCSTRSVDMVRLLGADRVIDRRREDFTRGTERYDLIFDVAVDRPFRKLKRVLSPTGKVVSAGAPYSWAKVLIKFALARVVSAEHRPKSFMSKQNKDDLAFLAGLLEDGRLVPIVDRTFALEEAPAAVRYILERRAQGKVVITP